MLRHYFPGFVQWLRNIRDPRSRPDRCTYPIEHVLMTVLIMHCGQCGSRRQLGRDLTGGRLGGNIWRMVGRAYSEAVIHPDTMNGVLEALDPLQLELLIAAVFSQLRKKRVLDRFRFDRELVVAVDATQVFSSRKPHCENCTHQTRDRVTPKLNLTGDGLHAEQTTMGGIDRRGWNLMITLTDDKLPSVTAQLPAHRSQWSGTRRETIHEPDKNGTLQRITRTVHWQTPVRYHGAIYHVVEMEDVDEEGKRIHFNRWIVNVKPDKKNAIALAQTGQLRWKIENQGTNTQKNGGHEMEHGFGRKGNAWKNYYLKLQISQLLNDLLRLGDIVARATGPRERHLPRHSGQSGTSPGVSSRPCAPAIQM